MPKTVPLVRLKMAAIAITNLQNMPTAFFYKTQQQMHQQTKKTKRLRLLLLLNDQQTINDVATAKTITFNSHRNNRDFI